MLSSGDDGSKRERERDYGPAFREAYATLICLLSLGGDRDQSDLGCYAREKVEDWSRTCGETTKGGD